MWEGHSLSTVQVSQYEELFDEAEQTGAWLFNQYYNLWLSPQELRDQWRMGKYRWGPSNWVLRHPPYTSSSLRVSIPIPR